MPVVRKETMFHTTPNRSHAAQPRDIPIGVVGAEALPASICTIAVRRYRDWSALILRGELDRPTVAEVRAVVETELAENRRVLIGLVGLDFSDVNGIRVFADLVRQGGSRGGERAVEVHGARGQVARLVRLLGLEDLITSDPVLAGRADRV